MGAVRRLFQSAGGERSGAAGLAGIPLRGAERESGSLFAALHGLYWLTVELAQDQPVALFVDDTHWVDVLSLRWLAYLSVRISAERVLLVVATRHVTTGCDEQIWPSLLSAADVLELGALGEGATLRLLQDVLGQPPHPSFGGRCLGLTKGNPLLVTELGRAAALAGVSPDEAGVRWLEALPAIGLLEEALQLATGPNEVVPRVDALTTQGALLRRQGKRRCAREMLGEAQTLAHEMGAVAALHRARDELLAAGGRPRRAATRGVDALTPAEVRVARLAAEGRSNPEIAQQLFITRRTVETHLTSTYSKLDLGGREQLAGALA